MLRGGSIGLRGRIRTRGREPIQVGPKATSKKGEQMLDRYSRFAPLTGAAWAVLAVVAIVVGPGETPEGDSRPFKVVHFYSSHTSEIETAGILFTIAFLAFLLFSGSLRAHLRRTPAVEPLATLALGAVVLMGGAAGIGGGIEFGLAHNIDHVTPQVAQAVNLVSREVFLPVVVGGVIFGLCNGLAILRGALLPRWLGWVAIVMAITFAVPPAIFVGFILLLAWSLVVAVLMFLRPGGAEPSVVPVGA